MEEAQPDNSPYKGDRFLYRMHGNGTYTWGVGNTYTGKFVEDQLEGYGEQTWADGLVYSG